MNINDLVWTNKDCCALHKHAEVNTPGGVLQIDHFGDGMYSVAAFNEYGGNIKHPLLDDVVMVGIDDISLIALLSKIAT